MHVFHWTGTQCSCSLSLSFPFILIHCGGPHGIDEKSKLRFLLCPKSRHLIKVSPALYCGSSSSKITKANLAMFLAIMFLLIHETLGKKHAGASCACHFSCFDNVKL